MFENLNDAVRVAGGCEFTWEMLEDMSAADLIVRLGCNHVRFCNENQGKQGHKVDSLDSAWSLK
jgi:hypothetical protein